MPDVVIILEWYGGRVRVKAIFPRNVLGNNDFFGKGMWKQSGSTFN